MGDLLLGIDIGTYSSKGVLVSPEGRILRQASKPHGVSLPAPGWVEQDANEVWWGDTVALCRELLPGAPYTGADVAAVAVSAIGPCLLPMDGRDQPLRPGILYGVDTRATAEVAWLEEKWGSEAIFGHAGMNLSSQAVGPKIRWLRANEPETWDRTAWLGTATSFLVNRLTGERVIDHHTASHYMPLYDRAAAAWTDGFAEGLVGSERLPRLGWSDEIAGTVTPQAAAETGLSIGTPVTMGAVDALSEAVSVGVTAPGDLMVMYGSTAFFLLVTDGFRPSATGWTTPGAFRDQHLLAAGMATSGALTRWFVDELVLGSKDSGPEVEAAYERLFQEAAAVPAGADGLVMLPYFSGERTPINDPAARGVIAGLTLRHGRSHLFRAALEGVAYGVRDNLQELADAGGRPQRVVAVGGGTRGNTWVQIVSDVADVVQLIPETTIGASFGDAFLAGVATGSHGWSDLPDWVGEYRQVVPNRETRATYDRGFRLFKELYAATKAVVHALAE